MRITSMRAVRPTVVVALLALLAASGCGSSSTTTAATNSAATTAAKGTTTLRASVFFGTAADQTTMKSMMASFMSSNPGIKVDVSYIPLGSYDQVVGTEVAGGNAPDIIEVSPGSARTTGAVPLASRGALLDLSGQPWVSRIPSSMKSLVSVGGKVYAWPQDMSVEGMIYNQTLLQKLGVQPPQTWTQALAYCQKLKSAGVTPIVLYNQDEFGAYQLLYSLLASDVYARTPDWDQLRHANKTTFASTAGWKQALDQYLQLRTAGCFQSASNGTPIAQALAELETGKAGGTPSVSAVLGVSEAGAPKEKFEMTPFPAADSGNAATAGPLTDWAVSANTHHKQQALAFVNYMAQPAVNRTWGKLSGNISTVDFAQLDLPAGLDTFKPFIAKRALYVFPGLNWPAGVQDTTLGPGIQALFAGSQTVQGLLSQLDSAWNTDASH